MTVSQQTWRLVCLSCVAVMKSATSVCLWDSLKPVGNNEEVQDSEPNKSQKRKKEDFYMTHSVLVWRVCLSNAKWSESTAIFLNQKMWEHSLKQGLLWIATPLNWTQFCSILIWSFVFDLYFLNFVPIMFAHIFWACLLNFERRIQI